MDPVEATDYHEIVQVADPQLAPGGDRVAFVRKLPVDEETHRATVYTVPVDGGEPTQFTVAEGVDSSPRYSPSGDRLAFVSTRGADDDRPQLWVMPTDGGEARQVTDVAGGVETIAWSPDGARIAFTQRSTPDEREAGLDLDLAGLEDDPEGYEREPPDPRVIDRIVFRTGTDYFDGSQSHLYLVDLDDDAVERLSAGDDDDAPIPSDGRRDFTAPEWGTASELYYAVCREPDPDDTSRYDVEALDLEAGGVETVVEASGWGVALAATADGRVAFPYTPPERTSIRQTDLRVHDRGTGETHEPTAELDRTLAFEPGIEWGPDEERLYVATPDDGAVALRRVDWDATDVETVLHEGDLTGFSVGERAVAVVQSAWDHRGDVFLVEGDGGSERLTDVNADYLEATEIGEPEELRFPGGDGDEVQGWVLTPPGFDPASTYPLAVEVHGGPHAMWSTSGTMWHEFQLLAARGYVVFWCNPRGSTGYGEAFMAAIDRDWGAVTMADVMAGVERVAEREYVDADDVHLTGGSFGGYMTGWMVGRTDRFASAVAQRGVYDQLGFYGSTDWAFKLVEGDYDTTPTEEPLFLWEQSPVGHAHEVSTPTLVVHADRDFRVPVNNAELFHRLLAKHGVDTRLVRYPRDGHELSRSGEPGHVVDRLERIVRWFDGYSAHHDAPRALDRGDDGLSAGDG